MKFILRRASEYCAGGQEIEINTLDELIKLVKKEECAIIVEYDSFSKDCENLTVYDDYLE